MAAVEMVRDRDTDTVYVAAPIGKTGIANHPCGSAASLGQGAALGMAE